MIYILLLILMVKGSPQLVALPEASHDACELDMAKYATLAAKSPEVHGFDFLPDSCKPIAEPVTL